MLNILIVEDNIDLRNLYSFALRKAGYYTYVASDGVQASDLMEKNYIDLIITDLMMPNMDGYEFVQSIRQYNADIPILVITARDDFNSKNQSFRLGSDDYMVKPIDINEMCLRVGALLRRAKIAHERKQQIGETVLDYDSLTVKRGDEEIMLSKKEFCLLYKLVSMPNKILTRRQLMDEFWGIDNESDERTIDVHISRLRKLFENNPDFRIVTIRGLGYKVVTA